MVCEALVDGYM